MECHFFTILRSEHIWLKPCFKSTIVKMFESPMLSNSSSRMGMGYLSRGVTLLEILSFATSHYATGMQLVVVCNYLGHVCNYKFGIV